MASFDVSNPVTSIPLDEVIGICADLLFDEHDVV